MNYFYSNSEKKKLGKIIEQPIFSEFVAYMSMKINSTKRFELKTKFPQKKFEHFLDQLMKNLVLHENRRYMFRIFEFNNERALY